MRLMVRLFAKGIGLKESDIHPKINILSAHTFTKSHGDAFDNEELNSFLIENKINHLCLVGVDGAHCVRMTALGARNRGYNVTLLTNGIAWFNEKRWQHTKLFLQERQVAIF